jgi:hypothetical protein
MQSEHPISAIVHFNSRFPHDDVKSIYVIGKDFYRVVGVNIDHYNINKEGCLFTMQEEPINNLRKQWIFCTAMDRNSHLWFAMVDSVFKIVNTIKFFTIEMVSILWTVSYRLYATKQPGHLQSSG